MASRPEYTTKYIKDNLERMEIRFQASDNMTEKIDEHCLKHGYVNTSGRYPGKSNRTEFIKKAIETQIAIDNGTLKVISE